MGETNDGGLYEIFQQDYGPVGSPSFEAARDNFIISSAGYAVASLLLQPKDIDITGICCLTSKLSFNVRWLLFL